MILVLIIGCLTPETFATQYVDFMCREVDECAVDSANVPMCDEEYDATVAHIRATVDCSAWDAGAAADCLDARAEWSECNDPWDSSDCAAVLGACQ